MSGNDALKKYNKLSDSEYFKRQNLVSELLLQGNTNYTDIARKVNITRAEVVVIVDQIKEAWQSMESFSEIARQRLREMDAHYSMLIKKSYERYEDLVEEDEHAKAAAILKQIGDIEAKRQDSLQKAGVYDDTELADFVAEAERKVGEISEFLVSFVKKNPEHKAEIVAMLRRVENPDLLPEPDIIQGDVS